MVRVLGCLARVLGCLARVLGCLARAQGGSGAVERARGCLGSTEGAGALLWDGVALFGLGWRVVGAGAELGIWVALP